MKKFIYLILWVGIPVCGFSQDTSLQNISGTVLTANEGRPLPGATVQLKGTSTGVNTDENGQFTLTVTARKVTLTISSLGYRSRDTALNLPLHDPLIITLIQDAAMLDAAVAKGYYTTSKEFNTGSVSTISSEILARQPVGDPLNALDGRVPGLYITQYSGMPGASLNVRLRGRNSIANGNDPLYIIDGVPFTSESLTLISGGGIFMSPFSSIGMQNIEQIDILKDADATAIYGSRGANGVVLITTKKGRAGKTEIFADYSQGFGEIVKGYEMMNTKQYLEMRREAFANDEATPSQRTYDLNGIWDTDRYTDWEDLFIGGTAQLANAQLSLSGGSQLTQFLIAGGYRKETTVFPGDYRNRKISLHSNINHQSSNKRFNSSFSITYMNDNNLLPPSDYTKFIAIAPNAPAIYNEDGSLNWANTTWANPFAALNLTSESITDNLNSALQLNYEIVPGFNISTRLGYNTIRLETTNLIPSTAVDPARSGIENTRGQDYGDNKLNSWIAEPGISFTKTIGSGKLDALVGITFQENKKSGFTLNARGFTSDALIENKDAATTISVGRTVFSQYRYNAIFARLGYTYLNRYIINLTGRRDGSSRFGPGKQFGNFGAIGAAWIFTNENYMKETLPFLSFGKLRFSYGITGNDQLADYKYLSTYASNSLSYQDIIGLNPIQHTNSDYGWESVKKLEGALELGLLDNRILFDFNWYRNRTENQLVGYSLAAMTGFPTVQANLPAVIQNSGVEFDLQAEIFRQGQLNWSVTGNLSIPRNKLVAYPNIEASSYSNRYVIGEPLSLSLSYHYTGIDPRSGVYTFEDINGDGAITFVGDRSPNFVGQLYFGGINNSFSFKGINLDIFFQYVKQKGYKPSTRGMPGSFGTSQGNQPQYVLDRWQHPGDQALYQKYSQAVGPAFTAYASYYEDSDALMSDASFVRLKNVSLSWSVPETLSKWANLYNLKVYMQGHNLLTFTGYKGVDPEMNTTRSMVLPPLRMITIGAQLSIR